MARTLVGGVLHVYCDAVNVFSCPGTKEDESLQYVFVVVTNDNVL